jgi:subtilisin family serine protease
VPVNLHCRIAHLSAAVATSPGARSPPWDIPVTVRLLALLCLTVATSISAQDKKRVEKLSDLPIFSYRIDGRLEDVVRNDGQFRVLAQAVRRDTEAVLAQYEIADRAELRKLRNVLVVLDYLDGRYDEALKGALAIRNLQEKPADKLLSGLQIRAQIAAQKKVGSTHTDAFRREVGRQIAAELEHLPYAVIENDVKSSKSRAETIGETLVLGHVRDVLQPAVTKSGSLSSDLVPGVISAKYQLTTTLPLKTTLIDTYAAYLNARKVEKPDIWAARDITLPAGRRYSPVKIAVWDSGVDTALFPDRVLRDASGEPVFLAFDRFGYPTPGVLAAVPAALRSRMPRMKSRMKGFSDLKANLDTAEASEVKQWLSTLKADEFRSSIEAIEFVGNYAHGTHVAGIAMAGNPYARLATARIEFPYTLLPDPCPSPEQSEREARNMQAYVDFMQREGVRVVNMSWGESIKAIEGTLELCNIGHGSAERQALARGYFEKGRAALQRAMAGAPDILFVTSAGNSNQDATFAEDYPAAIQLPNLITVGAVDKAGDEAPFTSYGPTVVVHANGFQVDSVIPGGERVPQSGTSMASPQVANLAAKMLAVNPALGPQELIAMIRGTAERSADGRRVLIHPKRAVAAAEARRDKVVRRRVDRAVASGPV